MLRVNFGSEKVSIYDRYRIYHENLGIFYGGDGPEDWAHALHWLRNATQWQDELTMQLESLGLEASTLKHVLVVDEFVADGSTSFLFLGLLAACCPDVRSILIDIDLDDWKGRLATLWLEQCQPNVLVQIEQQLSGESDDEKRNSKRFQIMHRIARLAAGTEDVRLDSLLWRPITADSPCVQELKYLDPGCDWYAFITWVEAIRDESIRIAVNTPREKLAAGQY